MTVQLRIILVALFVLGYLTIRIAQMNEGNIVIKHIQGRGSSDLEPDITDPQHVEVYGDEYGTEEKRNEANAEEHESNGESNPGPVETESASQPNETAGKQPQTPSPNGEVETLDPRENPEQGSGEVLGDIEKDPDYIRNSNGSSSFNPDAEPNYYDFTGDEAIPNFYNDHFDTYDCRDRFHVPGSHPRFMVLGVHKGGSTALYNYLAKHGRIRPAVCKEIHFFDVDEEYTRGKSYYLRHFPDVSIWKGKVITGEGSPDYMRVPIVPPRVKGMFPDAKFILTLREPGTRFQSHWVGKKDLHLGPLASMTCEQAWNVSVGAVERCLQRESLYACERKLHENAVMRGMYLPQIQRWIKFFPVQQFLIIQAEAMFHNITKVMQETAKFLNIRPYTVDELNSLQSAKTGSAHHDEPLAKDCDHLRERMDRFYEQPNRLLKEFFKKTFPHVLPGWQAGWSGM